MLNAIIKAIKKWRYFLYILNHFCRQSTNKVWLELFMGISPLRGSLRVAQCSDALRLERSIKTRHKVKAFNWSWYNKLDTKLRTTEKVVQFMKKP